jgi:hypothetical protein
MSGKKSYTECPRKAFIKQLVYPNYSHLDRVEGLAGPNIVEWVHWMRKNHFKRLFSWEHDTKTLTTQALSLKENGIKAVRLRQGDILNAEVRNDTFYELDFCGPMESFIPHIRKFTDNVMFNVTLRPGPKKFNEDGEIGTYKKEAIAMFFRERNEWRIGIPIQISKNVELVETTKGRYIIATYRDTQAMLTIAKLPKK